LWDPNNPTNIKAIANPWNHTEGQLESDRLKFALFKKYRHFIIDPESVLLSFNALNKTNEKLMPSVNSIDVIQSVEESPIKKTDDDDLKKRQEDILKRNLTSS